jgi:ParB-like chromosome segregation protein Spo0J
MELKIEYLDKNSLKPYANNAEIHTIEQVEQIKKSIREFGFNDPIAVWGENEIVEGHGRLLAAMEMDDIDTVPVIRLDELTDEQRRAYMLVHNKLTMNTGFDIDVLSAELDSITDIDMSDFGFELETQFDIDETDLDDDTKKENVTVSINCGDVASFESIKERLQNLADEISAKMSVKMS